MTTSFDSDLETLERLATEIREAARERDLEAIGERLAHRLPLLERVAEGVAEEAKRGEDVRDMSDRLAAILAIDREAERLLEAGRVELEAKLGEIGDGQRGLAGYSSGRGLRGARVDERG